jgi:hypothetical protein
MQPDIILMTDHALISWPQPRKASHMTKTEYDKLKKIQCLLFSGFYDLALQELNLFMNGGEQ